MDIAMKTTVRRPRSRPRRSKGVAIVLGFVLAILGSEAELWAAREPVTLGVEATIESPTLGDALDGQRADVEASLARELARIAGDYFGFVRWDGEPGAGARHDISLRLTVTQIDSADGCDFLTAVLTIPVTGAEPSSIPPISLGRDCQADLPSADGPDLVRWIVAHLDTRCPSQPPASCTPLGLATTPVSRAVVERGLSRVAVAAGPELLTIEDNKVLLDFARRDLRIREDSQMRIEFETRDENDQPRKGNVQIFPGGGWEEAIECKIKQLVFPPDADMSFDQATTAHPRFAEVFSNGADSKIFVEVYKGAAQPISLTGDGLIGDLGVSP